MKKQILFLFGLIPLAAGLLYVCSPMITSVEMILFMVLPWAVSLAWIWVGHRCGRDGQTWLRSVACCHWAVLLIVLCAVWQFGFTGPEAQNSVLVLLGQTLTGLVPGVFPLVAALTAVGDTVSGTAVMLWGAPATGIALVLLFSLGFWLGTKDRNASAS